MKGRNADGLKKMVVFGFALAYVGAVAYGDIMFLQVVSRAFPGNGILQALSYFGAIVTGVSACLLPLALYAWFTPGAQLIWGFIYWLLDIAVLILNSILAYELATTTVDDTMRVWQTMAPATPMLAVIGIGIAFMLDTSHQVRHAHAEMEADQLDILTDQMKLAARDPEVYATLVGAAKMSALQFAREHQHNQQVVPPSEVAIVREQLPSAREHTILQRLEEWVAKHTPQNWGNRDTVAARNGNGDGVEQKFEVTPAAVGPNDQAVHEEGRLISGDGHVPDSNAPKNS